MSTIKFLAVAALCSLAAGAPTDQSQRSFGYGGYNPMFNNQPFAMMNSPYPQQMTFPNAPPMGMGMGTFPGGMNLGAGYSPVAGYPPVAGGFPSAGYPAGTPGYPSAPMAPGYMQPGMQLGMQPGMQLGMQPSMQLLQFPFRSAEEKADQH